MHVHAAVVPPRTVLDAVSAAVEAAHLGAAVRAATPPSLPPSRAQRIRRRVAGRGARDSGTVDPAAQPPSQLDLLSAAAMSIPVAGFGSVTASDAARLATALRTAAADASAPTVRLAGATALEGPGDRSVSLRMVGDVDVLRAMVRGVTQVVEQRNFYVDRRKFQPLLAVATVNDATTAADLEAVVDALDGFTSEPWTIDHVRLMRPAYGSALGFEEMERLPLGR